MPLLLFLVGEAQYGLELEALQEVADDPQLYPLPRHGDCLLGAINLHGRILPVIDLPALFGFNGARRDPRLVVMNPEYHCMALAVSGVGRIVSFASGDLQLPPAGLALPAVAGVLDIDAQRIHLLDAGVVVERLQELYVA